MSACPALFISAPASGQGKTTITAGLARYHRRLGRRVRVFKTGPDFLDPMILSRASGAPVLSLDLWMVGKDACRNLLAQAADEADLILIEGVMGLFDGTPSSADLATEFGVPVLAVISAKAMAQTFGAVAFGLANFRPQVPFHGVLANRVGSSRHAQMLEEALPATLRWCGHITASDEIELPDRHLGLHQAAEIDDLDARLDRAADALSHTTLAGLPPAVEFGAATPQVLPGLLHNKKSPSRAMPRFRSSTRPMSRCSKRSAPTFTTFRRSPTKRRPPTPMRCICPAAIPNCTPRRSPRMPAAPRRSARTRRPANRSSPNAAACFICSISSLTRKVSARRCWACCPVTRRCKHASPRSACNRSTACMAQ